MTAFGKICFAEFGSVKDYYFLFGLQLGFEFGDGGAFDGGKTLVNIGKDCQWKTCTREQGITVMVDRVAKILEDAKVNYVSELVGKPVKIYLCNNMVVDFDILTEVL